MANSAELLSRHNHKKSSSLVKKLYIDSIINHEKKIHILIFIAFLIGICRKDGMGYAFAISRYLSGKGARPDG